MSYNEKHNEANGEDNNDGESHNRSWNCGVEGPTDDPEILALRARAAAQLARHPAAAARACRCCCTATSSAAPSRATTTPTPRTTSSAGCDWDDADQPLVEFTAAVARLRRDHPTFRRKRFFTGGTVRVPDGGDGDRLNDIVWLHLDGRPIEDDDWDDGAKALGMYLNGDGIAGRDARGEQIIDDHFLLYFNADGPADRHLAAGGVRRGVGRRDRHRRARPTRARRWRPGRRTSSTPAACSCCASTASRRAEPDHSVAASVAAAVRPVAPQSVGRG